jgi:hypothetical protein
MIYFYDDYYTENERKEKWDLCLQTKIGEY